MLDASDNYYLLGRFLSPDGEPLAGLLGEPFIVAEGLEEPYADVAYDSVSKRWTDTARNRLSRPCRETIS